MDAHSAQPWMARYNGDALCLSCTHVRVLTSAGLWCGLVFQSEFLVTPGASATFTCSGKEVTGSAADEATADGTGAADGAGGGAGATSVATASDSGARLLVYVVFPIDESVKV